NLNSKVNQRGNDTNGRDQLPDRGKHFPVHEIDVQPNENKVSESLSHHQIAAVDVEGRTGNITGGLGGSEANQIGDFERGAEARYGIARGETFEQLIRGMFAR